MKRVIAAAVVATATLVASCGGTVTPSAAPSPTLRAGIPTPVEQTATPVLPEQGEVAMTVAEGTKAAYIVREQLARLDFPNDAVGITKQVEGAVVFKADGTVDAERSRLRVDLRTLNSDESRRDNFVRENTLQTSRFPFAELAVQRVEGLSWPLPTSGHAEFQVHGDMTIHGVTKPLTWQVTATFSKSSVSGQATTNFKFGDFNMSVPRVFVVLSVEDNIQLRIEFEMRRTG
ncbi:MAG: YceI family protein [SAR202 cluster bacterium]|nr:YceI family protein [SAR202 cluster bacterium]